MYLATQVMREEDKEKLKNTFVAMDKNGDGKLSRSELIAGFISLGEYPKVAAIKVDDILSNIDTDKNGFIVYSEFLMALMSKKQVLSKKSLKQAFNTFDKNGDGFIDSEEIKDLLGMGQEYSEKTWKTIVDQIDKNKDGKISFEEFEIMMKKFI